jgi:hypothetical protein
MTCCHLGQVMERDWVAAGNRLAKAFERMIWMAGEGGNGGAWACHIDPEDLAVLARTRWERRERLKKTCDGGDEHVCKCKPDGTYLALGCPVSPATYPQARMKVVDAEKAWE